MLASLSRSPRLWNAARNAATFGEKTASAWILIGKNSEGGGCSLGLQYRKWLEVGGILTLAVLAAHPSENG
ncbi:uncharacterized protein TrAFT101_006820 [Trichoderma asperellum]|uniref:uncharacterized protein n=1 Tax=Trichoderma asperellum TaxID=101201 RepID=UPI00331690AC|nr:hypothetical protein TrAFT101_006820 [Trichoderma asperellum]